MLLRRSGTRVVRNGPGRGRGRAWRGAGVGDKKPWVHHLAGYPARLVLLSDLSVRLPTLFVLGPLVPRRLVVGRGLEK